MTHQFNFPRLLPNRQYAALLLGIFLALTALDTWAVDWGAGISAAGKSISEQMQQQIILNQQFEQQKKLLEYQYQLENERQQRAQQLEMQRQERERAEARRQQQIAEEKKQQDAAEQKRTALSTGTGFFVAPGGYLVTNHHVVDDTTDYAIRDHKGRFYKATIVARDSNRDLALLKVDGAFPTLRIVSSDAVSKGQRVLAVGYPQISIQGNESKVTDGIISSFSGVRNDESWFQISVPIQGGNSGGPLVTESGGVVGVVVATANVARFYKMTGNLPQNVNYAIKSKVLLEFLNAQNLQNVTATKGKISVEAVDASTVLVIAKNGAIDVAYTASPEQTAREERERAKEAANELKRQREEALVEQKRLAEARRMEKQRSDEVALMAKRDAAVLKAFPDWSEIKVSNIFLAWLAEQRKEMSDKLDSGKAADVIAVIRRYHAELPKFANRYAAATQRPETATPPGNTSSPALPLPSQSLMVVSPETLAKTTGETVVGEVLELFPSHGYLVMKVWGPISLNGPVRINTTRKIDVTGRVAKTVADRASVIVPVGMSTVSIGDRVVQ
jgi:S1-C subfamily serine protease